MRTHSCKRVVPAILLTAWAILLTLSVAQAAETPAASAPRQEAKMTAPKGFLLKTIKRGDSDRRYLLYVPADYDGSKPWPLILFLHGAGECGTDGLNQLHVGLGPAIMKHPDRWPFLVLIPQKANVPETWASYDDTLMQMIETTKHDYQVDTTRLYLTGLSQGGYGTWAIGAKHPDLFAAIAPICGGGKPSTAPDLKGMPIWAFHGEADPTVPVTQSQQMVKAVQDAGGDAKLTIYPGVGHNSWDNAYAEEMLPGWFLQHTRAPK